MAEALRTAGKMTDTLLKRFILVENPNGMIGKKLIPISSPQILLVQRPCGTYNHICIIIIFEGKYHGTSRLAVDTQAVPSLSSSEGLVLILLTIDMAKPRECGTQFPKTNLSNYLKKTNGNNILAAYAPLKV